ncbi:MAG TPA: putative zinc-binding metallopeptidase [Steroidobacteraceae bacterium]|nr:putative zinc-binding metallopeptidase [Steroidobacteraceae bacterium]
MKPQRTRPSRNRTSRQVRRPAWTRLSDEGLLSLRFCDLGLRLQGSRLEGRVRRLYAELNARGIRFHPHVWLSEEWFSPDGVPGIAIPFYLMHPRLERLERRIMREAEGGNAPWFMRILRHEAGHALDNAYRLRRRKRWREVFGPASLQYPARYKARPGSRRYVHHLGEWYAQSHPTEDFAETFAVWLKPRSGWRKSYAEWPAFQKLSVVDELMSEVRGHRPPVRNRLRIEPLETNTRTLAQHYRRKLVRQSYYRRGLADEFLHRLFAPRPARGGAVRAASLLRANRKSLIASVSRKLGLERYSVQQIVRMLIERSENLKLYVRGNRRDAIRSARWLLERLASLYAQGETPHLRL